MPFLPLTSEQRDTITDVVTVLLVLISAYLISVYLLKGNVMKSDNKVSLYLLYTRWCGYSTQFLPTWDMLEEKYRNSANVKLVKVDCEEDSETCQNFGVSGYPSLVKVSANGKQTTYRGERSFAKICEFVDN